MATAQRRQDGATVGLRGGQSKAKLEGHGDGVTSVAFSPDGKTLATGSTDRTVKLWDVATAKEAATLAGHKNWVTSVRFSPDGKVLAAAAMTTRRNCGTSTAGKRWGRSAAWKEPCGAWRSPPTVKRWPSGPGRGR